MKIFTDVVLCGIFFLIKKNKKCGKKNYNKFIMKKFFCCD